VRKAHSIHLVGAGEQCPGIVRPIAFAVLSGDRPNRDQVVRVTDLPNIEIVAGDAPLGTQTPPFLLIPEVDSVTANSFPLLPLGDSLDEVRRV
jgi:hypothetical protein